MEDRDMKQPDKKVPQGQKTAEPEKKKRGPKPLGPGEHRAPRKLVWGCAAVIGDKKIREEIVFAKPEDSSKENAMAEFGKRHNSAAPDFVFGPYREFKGLGAKVPGAPRQGANPDMVEIPFDQIDYNSKKYSGVYKGWEVKARGIVGRDDVVGDVRPERFIDATSKKRIFLPRWTLPIKVTAFTSLTLTQ
jgi:hypothetical protein